MIDLTEYRTEFGRFNSRIELFRYEHRNSEPPPRELERIVEPFVHLFTRATVVELFELAESVEHLAETERAARRALAAAAAKVYVDLAVREYEAECRRCESSARTDRDGAQLDQDQLPTRIADEAERPARVEWEHRWRRALRNCSEPRWELIQARRTATQGLNPGSGSQDLSGLGGPRLQPLRRMATGFLELTETQYFHALARLRGRNEELQTVGSWEFSDLLRWRRLARFDRLFPSASIGPALRTALNKLRISLDEQPNLRLETLAPGAFGCAEASCYRIDPPADVRLTLTAADGALHFRRGFDMMGRAQHQTWTSAGLAARYPEYVYSADQGTNLAFGELFANLHWDTAWLAELYTRGNEVTAAELVREFALLALNGVREDCAQFLFLTDHSNSDDLADESTRAEYAERMRSATGFGGADLSFLWKSNEASGPADRLRAAFFETHFSEHLRSSYGRRWWADRKASDELRDVWNTGSRYPVEELAGSLGLGEIGFEATADRLSALIA